MRDCLKFRKICEGFMHCFVYFIAWLLLFYLINVHIEWQYVILVLCGSMGWVSEEGVTSVTPFIMFMIPLQRLLNRMENYKCVMDAKFKYDYLWFQWKYLNQNTEIRKSTTTFTQWKRRTYHLEYSTLSWQDEREEFSHYQQRYNCFCKACDR